ncbi:NUDIX hydrolase [Myxococcota bacterium]
MSLPAAPTIQLELLEDLSPPTDGGFLRLVRRRYRAHYPDGRVSLPFVYDAVDRAALDAVVIAAHFEQAKTHHVYLRTAVRPPLLLRSVHPVMDPPNAALWELPAGLVDTNERETWEGVRRAAQRELDEELGFTLAPGRLEPLGPSVFPAPGFVGERHFFFCARVDPSARNEPTLDGSALEQGGMVAAMPLSEALFLCQTGEIQDSKTELGLRRLRELLT